MDKSITIHGWMIEKLGLSGDELFAFAVIYEKSRDKKIVKIIPEDLEPWTSKESNGFYLIIRLCIKKLVVWHEDIAPWDRSGLYVSTTSGIN